jgi:hypothetical protein
VPHYLEVNIRLLSLIIEAGISNLETISLYSFFINSGASISVV